VQLLQAIQKILKPTGHLIIQTVHPFSAAGEKYEDGWREETFETLPGSWEPMPWYFRTMTSWVNLINASGWKIERLLEPVHPATKMPASLILDLVQGHN
jgi:hypothetical protein